VFFTGAGVKQRVQALLGVGDGPEFALFRSGFEEAACLLCLMSFVVTTVTAVTAVTGSVAIIPVTGTTGCWLPAGIDDYDALSIVLKALTL
jgi:hypothetical protein